MGSALEEVVIENSQHSLVMNEVQLLLAEKRTSLSSLNAGLTVVAVPLSIVSLLVVTSKYYETETVVHLLAPLWAACIILFVLGMYIIMRALARIRRFDERIESLKDKDSAIRQLIEVD